VFEWQKRFRGRLETIGVDARSGRPSAIRTPKNTEQVREIVHRNCQIAVRLLSGLLYIGKTAIHEMFPEDPGNPSLLTFMNHASYV
jgi:hypothetical protein